MPLYTEDPTTEPPMEASIHSLKRAVSDDELGALGSSLRFVEAGAMGSPAVASPRMGRLGMYLTTKSRESLVKAAEASPLLRKLVKSSDGSAAGPPLLKWILPALACACSYALYNIFIKAGSATISPMLGAVVLQFVAALLGTILLLSIIYIDVHAMPQIHYDQAGLKWSVCAGLAVGSAEMLSFLVSSLGVPATRSIPIIIGGSVLFGSILGLLLLKEQMMDQGWMGIALLICGIGLVATDPGDHVSEVDGHEQEEAPLLLVWIWPALVCANAYALYNFFIKLGSASINPILGGVILQFVAAMLGTILLGGVMAVSGIDSIMFAWEGFYWAVLAGVAVGAAEMLSFCVSGMGVQVSQSIPVIIGGSVLFGAVLGLIMLGESLELQGWAGVAILTGGIAFVATDPGGKMEGH